MADPFYGSTAGFLSYHAARGNTVPAGLDDATTAAALLVASEWIDNRYRSAWMGFKVAFRAQVREWPRTGVTDVYGYSVLSDSVPREVENATYEVALRQIVLPGSLARDYTPSKYKNVSIDGSISVEYQSFAYAGDAQTQFLIVDQILSGLLRGNNLDSGLTGGSYRT